MRRITHEIHPLQTREVAKKPSRDTREAVVVLLRDEGEVRSEATVVVACGGRGAVTSCPCWKRERGEAHHARDTAS